jgi:glutamyl-tRNA reductase
MMLLAVGCSSHTAPVEFRERVAFDQHNLTRALEGLAGHYGCEAVILSTCNRVEVYLAYSDTTAKLDGDQITAFLAEFHQLSKNNLAPYFHEHYHTDAVRHLFRVVASLDSMIIGEGQIAGQVKRAYEMACDHGTAGPILHTLFQHAHAVAKRVRAETGIARGHVSVSSVAVDYVRQVFDRFDNKTVLVIGAGKMGELTLRYLRELKPQQIWVANRSPEKAEVIAAGCGGSAVPWDKLDDALAKANIVLSTTGASEPIMTLERYRKIRSHRSGSAIVILDIAVPRDFDPRIHDGDCTYLFNVDDLQCVRDQTLQERQKHVPAAEAIVEEETRRLSKNWSRRRNGMVIARLTQQLEAKREAIVELVLGQLNGRLSGPDRDYLAGAFRLLQNQFLHGPVTALTEEIHQSDHQHTLVDALRKLFRLNEDNV